MKKSNPLFLCSLTSLALMSASLVYAHDNESGQIVYIPVLEGGITGSVGTFLVAPTSDFQSYTVFENPEMDVLDVEFVNPGYSWGIDASLGYIFEETANSVELFYRNITTSDKSSASGVTFEETFSGDFQGDLGYELESFDLMFSQFINLGQVMQLRLSGGLAYVDLEESKTVDLNGKVDATPISEQIANEESRFAGWGPRVGIDTRYGFNDEIEGFGIVGGGSMAYYLGDMDASLEASVAQEPEITVFDNPGNHAVLNFRANLGIDYVYFFDNNEGSTLGLELGYLIDYYDDGVLTPRLASELTVGEYGSTSDTSSISFAGPYLNLKGVF